MIQFASDVAVPFLAGYGLPDFKRLSTSNILQRKPLQTEPFARDLRKSVLVAVRQSSSYKSNPFKPEIKD